MPKGPLRRFFMNPSAPLFWWSVFWCIFQRYVGVFLFFRLRLYSTIQHPSRGTKRLEIDWNLEKWNLPQAQPAGFRCFGACLAQIYVSTGKMKPAASLRASLAWCFFFNTSCKTWKNWGTPKSSVLIGSSIIFTIHFGVLYPYFWKYPHIAKIIKCLSKPY